MRSEGPFVCVCVCVCCNVLREMLDVNVKVEVRTQYKSKNHSYTLHQILQINFVCVVNV